MAHPIWKDYYVTLGAANSYPFRIFWNNNEVYQGKAYRDTTQDNCTIRINDICEWYMKDVIPTFINATFTNVGDIPFIIQAQINGVWTQVDEVLFYADWSYDYAYNPEVQGMSFPILKRVDLNQWITYSTLNESEVNASVVLRDGTVANVVIPIAISADFNSDFNNDFARSIAAATNGTAVFKLSQFGDVRSITIGTLTYEVVESCHRYAIYYRNSYGGWDSLLIEGNNKITDTVERHLRGVNYDNREVSNRGIANYLNIIKRGISLKTGWLTTEESLRMPHLLNATQVYLYDFETSSMLPVVLTNSTTEHKTFKNIGRQMIAYTIDVELAIEMKRM